MARGSAVATDNFNRALIGTDWTSVNTDYGNIKITSSTYAEGSASWPTLHAIAAKWTGAGSFDNDHWASGIMGLMSALSVDFYTGVAVRVGTGTNATHSYYGATVAYEGSSPSSCTTKLFKCVNDTITTLNSASVSWANGDRIELEVQGTTLRLCKNGTALGGSFTQTDSDLSTGLPGIVATNGTSLDDWQAGNFVADGGFLSRNYWWGNQ